MNLIHGTSLQTHTIHKTCTLLRSTFLTTKPKKNIAITSSCIMFSLGAAENFGTCGSLLLSQPNQYQRYNIAYTILYKLTQMRIKHRERWIYTSIWYESSMQTSAEIREKVITRSINCKYKRENGPGKYPKYTTMQCC